MKRRLAVLTTLMAIAPAGLAGPYDKGISLTAYSAKKGGFDTVMVGSFTIKNDNTYFVKDFEVVCQHFAPSGTQLAESRKVIYDSVGPGQSRTFSNINVGFIPDQAKTFKCELGAHTKR